LTVCGDAYAQNTLGELKAAGATKLDAAQAKTLISGSNFSGPTQGGGTMSVDYKADGTYSGTFTTRNGKGGGRFGKWTLDDSGKFCTEGVNQSYGATAAGSCAYLFKLGDEYFVVFNSDADAAAQALKRTIKH
jgi:hypothetical protein